MADERVLVVRMLGDSRQLEQTYARAAASSQTFGRSVKAANAEQTKFQQAARGGLGQFGGKTGFLFGSPTFIAAAAVTGAAKVGIEAASNLNEQISKSRQVFEDSSAEIEAWSKNSARNLGLARDQAVETASSFGALFRPLGLSIQESVRQSEKLTQLGADLASFYNTDVADALAAIRSGLVGEVEPLRRYGIILSETRVQQEALRETGKKHAEQLTSQEKVLARITLIYRDSAKAQGDFQRTSGGLANQTRILKAETRDLAAALGQDLIPPATRLITVLNRDAEAANKLVGELNKVGSVKFPQGPGGGLLSKLGLDSPLSVLKKSVDLSFHYGPGGAGFTILNWLQGKEKPKPIEVTAEFKADASSLNALTRDVKDAVQSGAAKAPIAFGQPGFRPERPSQALQLLAPTATQRNQWFDAAIGRRVDRAQAKRTLDEQIAALRVINADIQKRIDITKDRTRILKLEDDQFAIQQTIAADIAQKQADVLAANEKAAQDAKEAAQKAAERLQERQYIALGLSAQGQPRAPGLEALRRLFGRTEDAIKGTFLDTAKTRSVFGGIRQLLRGQFGQLTEDTRRAMERLLHNLDDALDAHSKKRKEITKGGVFNTAELLGGVGLTAEQARALRARLAHIGPLDRVLNAQGAVAGAVAGTSTINTTITLDGEVVGRHTTKYQQGRTKVIPVTRGGRNPGAGVVG